MQIIARSTLVEFWTLHPETKASLQRWLQVTKRASWRSMADVQTAFPKGKVLNGERVRFEIHGGDFRMIVAFDFSGGRQLAYVKFMGSHAQYDSIDALTVAQY